MTTCGPDCRRLHIDAIRHAAMAAHRHRGTRRLVAVVAVGLIVNLLLTAAVAFALSDLGHRLVRARHQCPVTSTH
jgi:hypothetical protein